MENKFVIADVTPSVLEKIYEGIIDENTYYSCELVSEDLSSDELVNILGTAQWENPASEPIEKNRIRALSLLKNFNVKKKAGEGVILGFNRVDLIYEKETKTVAFKNLKEMDDSRVESIPQMTETELKKFIKSSDGLREEVKEYPSKIIKIVNKKGGKKCKECDGTGKTSCPHCTAVGKGDCPDCGGSGYFEKCEFGEKTFVKGKWVYYGDYCPRCNGKGHFDCDVCNRTGIIECPKCNGTGHPIADGKEQKVTELKERYSLVSRGEVYLPDETTMKFMTFCLKPYLDKAKCEFVWNIKESRISGTNDSDAYKDALTELNSILDEKTLFGFSYVAYRIPKISLLTYNYGEEDYKIIVIGNRAFTKELPEISLMESLLGTYKKKIK